MSLTKRDSTLKKKVKAMDRWIETKRGKDGEGRNTRKKEGAGWVAWREEQREGGFIPGFISHCTFN